MDITEEGKLTFQGKGGPDSTPYACDLQLFKPVDSKVRSSAAAGLFWKVHRGRA